MSKKHVLIVGGGFAGLSCANHLIKSSGGRSEVHITLIDKNNFNEFKPLLYQVATAALSIQNVVSTLRQQFLGKSNVDIKMAEVTTIDPHRLTVSTKQGQSYTCDFLVLAAGAVVNYFNVEGAKEFSFPLYNIFDADRLRSRVISMFENADRDRSLIQKGILNFVVVGGGATGTEIAGALADLFYEAMPSEFSDLVTKQAKIYLVDGAENLLNGFTKESQEYAFRVLTDRGVMIKLGSLAKSISKDVLLLSTGETIISKTVIWAGGLQAAPLAAHCQLSVGHGGRIDVQPNLSVSGFPAIYALGDLANIKDGEGKFLPQLASVAAQSGVWAAKNILADIEGREKTPFHYRDKGIMAMVGKNAAVLELGKKRRKMHGFIAFIAWLLVHAALLPNLSQKILALFYWSWNYLRSLNILQVIYHPEEAEN